MASRVWNGLHYPGPRDWGRRGVAGAPPADTAAWGMSSTALLQSAARLETHQEASGGRTFGQFAGDRVKRNCLCQRDSHVTSATGDISLVHYYYISTVDISSCSFCNRSDEIKCEPYEGFNFETYFQSARFSFMLPKCVLWFLIWRNCGSVER